MSDDDLSLLESFYAAERSRADMPVDVEARLLAAMTSLAVAPPSPPSPPGQAMMTVSKAVAGMIASAIVAGIGGALIATAMRPPAPAPAPPPPSVPAPIVTPSASPPVVTMETGSLAPPPSARPQIPSGPATLAAERALLDEARAALSRGEAESAIALVARHEKTFRHGQLVEEREAIAIRSLAAAGQKPAARARADRFFTTYPKSPSIPAIRAALEE